MAQINNETVNYNDAVFDLIHGWGRVASTEFNNIAVRFDSGIRVSYEDGGVYAGQQRLFWHNPIIYIPMKNKTLWEATASAAASLAEIVRIIGAD